MPLAGWANLLAVTGHLPSAAIAPPAALPLPKPGRDVAEVAGGEEAAEAW